MRSFEEDLSRAITFHGHLCGGQITGVRMARYALKYFGIEDPDHYRDLIVYVECDVVSRMRSWWLPAAILVNAA